MAQAYSAGDFEIGQIVLIPNHGEKAYDINDIVSAVSLYESIFVPFVTASLYIKDSIGFFDKAPIEGNETVIISVFQGGESITSKQFKCIAIKNKEDFDNQMSTYRLQLVSDGYLLNDAQQVNMSYRDFPHKIVEKIIQDNELDSFTPINKIDDTTNRIHTNINKKKPIDSILKTTKAAVSNYADELDMFYFETLDGMNMRSFYDMYESDSPHDEYIADPFLRYDTTSCNEAPIGENTTLFYHYKVKDSSNSLREFAKGTFASTAENYDLTSGQIRRLKFDYLADVKSPSDIKSPFFSTKLTIQDQSVNELSSALHMNYPSATDTVHSDVDQISEVNFEYMQKRISLLNTILSHRIECGFYGNFEIRAGDTLNITLSVPFPRSEDEYIDDEDGEWRKYSGKFLVTGTHHVFDKNLPQTFVEVTKVGLSHDIEESYD